MSAFLDNLHRPLDSLGLVGARVLVAVSGGADSVALLRSMQALSAAYQLRLTAAHLNHSLRPQAADEDEHWTRELCQRLGVPIVAEKVDVHRYAKEKGLNIEEAARIVRYNFFEHSARLYGCTHIAVAHTANDRVETLLHNFFRGTGLAGLRGMPASRPLDNEILIVRPLLGVYRAAIEDWLKEIGQDFRIDATNFDESRTRNRIRHTLLPMLEQVFGPQFRASLLRLADQANELQTEIQEAASGILKIAIIDNATEVCRLNCERLENQPRYIVREAFVELWRQRHWPRQAMGFEDWDRLCRLLEQGGKITLPGQIEAQRRGSLFILSKNLDAPAEKNGGCVVENDHSPL